MRHFHRFIVLSTLLCSGAAHALTFFIDGLDWRATETNDWGYVNSLTVPNQTLTYKTIDFNNDLGFRMGAAYISSWDALFAYTHFYTSTNDASNGPIQPAFLGAVTAKPSHAYLYDAGQVNQSISYNIFDLDVGKQFYPASSLMLHPIAGIMGGWIDQSIHAGYSGSTSANEYISNNFSGIGPKAGIDTNITLFDYNGYQPQLVASFAASYLLGHWTIKDTTYRTPVSTYYVEGTDHSMGAVTLQSSLGIKLDYKNVAVKLAYELNDWLDQTQIFDNDTGAHNNDLILQGITLGLSYRV